MQIESTYSNIKLSFWRRLRKARLQLNVIGRTLVSSPSPRNMRFEIDVSPL